jgi:hypothetical protein
VASVEPLGVAAVQALESRRELLDGRRHDEVVVVRHQAEGVQLPLVPPDDEAEKPEERAAIVVVAVDGDAPSAAGGDVEEAVGEDVTRHARHRVRR